MIKHDQQMIEKKAKKKKITKPEATVSMYDPQMRGEHGGPLRIYGNPKIIEFSDASYASRTNQRFSLHGLEKADW